MRKEAYKCCQNGPSLHFFKLHNNKISIHKLPEVASCIVRVKYEQLSVLWYISLGMLKKDVEK